MLCNPRQGGEIQGPVITEMGGKSGPGLGDFAQAVPRV